MIFTIALFFFCIASAFALIAHKIWQIRSGKYAPGTYEEADWTDLSIESVRTRLLELAKFGAHHFALSALKLWILVANWVKRSDKKIKDKLTAFVHKHGRYPHANGAKPSGFIRRISEHKETAAPVADTEEK